MLEDTIVEEDIHPVYVSEGLTDTGKVRTANQDAFVQLGARGVWGVADGMGGYRDGDVASRMVCEGLLSMDSTTSLEGTIDAIRQRMSEVNAKLHQASIREHDPIISGSTVAIFVVQRTACAVVWAGDSRVYRLRHKRLTQMTTDHTWASELNLQQPNEEADHAITRAVGGEDTLLLDVRRDRVRLPDGGEAVREYVVHPGAVLMIPVLDNGRLIAVRQFRYPQNRAFVEFPAGKLDAGETALATAQRELV